MADFLNRGRELGRLGDSWQRAQKGTPQLVMVWGRRRVVHLRRGSCALLNFLNLGKY